MEQIWYIPNLIALFGTVFVLVWQSINEKEYAKKQHENCEDRVEELQQELSVLRLEIEKLNLLLMGKGGIVIHGRQVDVNRDIVGGNSSVGGDSNTGKDVNIDKR